MQNHTVEAERFILRDAEGVRRGELSVDEGKPGLALFHADGAVRVLLQVNPEGSPGFVLYDDKGIQRLFIMAGKEWTFIELDDKNGSKRLGMVVPVGGGEPFVALLDEDGTLRTQLTVAGGPMGSLMAFDAKKEDNPPIYSVP